MSEPDLETQIRERLALLRTEAAALRTESANLRGKVQNRDPVLVQTLQRQNAALKSRLSELEKAVYGLTLLDAQPVSDEDKKLSYELVRQAAVDFFKKTNVNVELWKNLES